MGDEERRGGTPPGDPPPPWSQVPSSVPRTHVSWPRPTTPGPWLPRPDRPAGLPPPPPAGVGYRSAAARARVTVILLALAALTSAVAVGSDLAEYRLVTRVVEDPGAVTLAQVSAQDQRQATIGLLQLGLLLVSAAAFIPWLWRVYANLEPLGARRLRFGRGWAVGGWFVPFLNLVRPKQVVDDAWRASDPRLAPVDPMWRGTRVPVALHLWWGTYLLSNSLGSTIMWSRVGAEDPEALRATSLPLAVVDGLDVVAALLAIWVVLALTRRQERRLEAAVGATLGTRPTRRGDRTSGAPLVGAGVVALAVAALTAVLFTPAPAGDGLPPAVRDDTGVIVAPGALRTDQLRVGDCFDAVAAGGGFVETLAVPATPCAGPHDHEVFAAEQLAFDPSAGYPGDHIVFQRAADLCLDAFARVLRVDFETSPYDVFLFHPTADTWAAGDREVVCAVYRLDGEKMTGSAAS